MASLSLRRQFSPTDVLAHLRRLKQAQSTELTGVQSVSWGESIVKNLGLIFQMWVPSSIFLISTTTKGLMFISTDLWMECTVGILNFKRWANWFSNRQALLIDHWNRMNEWAEKGMMARGEHELKEWYLFGLWDGKWACFAAEVKEPTQTNRMKTGGSKVLKEIGRSQGHLWMNCLPWF